VLCGGDSAALSRLNAGARSMPAPVHAVTARASVTA